MKIRRNRVMEVNDLISAFFNLDFDGDNMIVAGIHSVQAQDEFHKLAIKNTIEFEHADKLLIDFEHESIYAAYGLSKAAHDEYNKLIDLIKNEDKELIEEIDDLSILNDEIMNNVTADTYLSLFGIMKSGGVLFAKSKNYDNNKKIWTLFELIINKVFGFANEDDFIYSFEENGVIDKKVLNKITWNFYQILKNDGIEKTFWDRIHIVNKFLLEAGTRLTPGVASFDFGDFVVDDEEIDEFKTSLIQKEPFLAFHQNMILFEDYIVPKVNQNENSDLNKLFQSGARLKSVQLLKAASNTGIPTDIYGKAVPLNIKNALLDGLTQEDYFKSGDSARLALQQRQDAIPKAGELQRKFFFVTGILKQDKDVHDCFEHTGKQKYFDVEIKDKRYLEVLKHRWYKLSEDEDEKIIQGDEDELIGKTILLRTPVTCQLENYRVCQKCLGEKRPMTANLGAPIGQYLSEAILQLVLRAHHFGGVFLANIDKELINILREVKLYEDENCTYLEGDKEKIAYVYKYLRSKYPEENAELYLDDIDDNNAKLTIIIHEMPYSEDAVKILSKLTSLIDKTRKKKDFIDIHEIFDELVTTSYENGMLNLYFELALSLVFYDEDNVLYRYTDKPLTQQLSLLNVIDNIDSKLNIFYNFSAKTIQKIFAQKNVGQADHMYRDLIDLYK